MVGHGTKLPSENDVSTHRLMLSLLWSETTVCRRQAGNAEAHDWSGAENKGALSSNRTSVSLVPQEHHRRKGERTEELEDGEEAHKGSLLTCCGYCPLEPGSAQGLLCEKGC